MPGAHVGFARGAGLLDLVVQAVARRERGLPGVEPAEGEADGEDRGRIVLGPKDGERLAASAVLGGDGGVDVREPLGERRLVEGLSRGDVGPDAAAALDGQVALDVAIGGVDVAVDAIERGEARRALRVADDVPRDRRGERLNEAVELGNVLVERGLGRAGEGAIDEVFVELPGSVALLGAREIIRADGHVRANPPVAAVCRSRGYGGVGVVVNTLRALERGKTWRAAS